MPKLNQVGHEAFLNLLGCLGIRDIGGAFGVSLDAFDVGFCLREADFAFWGFHGADKVHVYRVKALARAPGSCVGLKHKNQIVCPKLALADQQNIGLLKRLLQGGEQDLTVTGLAKGALLDLEVQPDGHQVAGDSQGWGLQ